MLCIFFGSSKFEESSILFPSRFFGRKLLKWELLLISHCGVLLFSFKEYSFIPFQQYHSGTFLKLYQYLERYYGNISSASPLVQIWIEFNMSHKVNGQCGNAAIQLQYQRLDFALRNSKNKCPQINLLYL